MLLIQRTSRPLNTTLYAAPGASDILRLWGMGEHDGCGQLDVYPHPTNPSTSIWNPPTLFPAERRLTGCGFARNRSVQSDLRIQNRAISRLHAELHLQDEKVSAPSHSCARCSGQSVRVDPNTAYELGQLMINDCGRSQVTIENKSNADPNPLSVNGAQLDGKRDLSAGDLIEVRCTQSLLLPSVALPQQRRSVAAKPAPQNDTRTRVLISSCWPPR
jgi:hypothetical protein